MQVSDTMLTRIGNIYWLCHCGEPYSPKITLPTKQVKNWKTALEHCRKARSDEAWLEARNAITSYLHTHHNSEYQKWGEIVTTAKAQMSQLIDARLDFVFDKYRIDDLCFIHTTRWIVLNAMMEDAYRELLPSGPFFFDELLSVYEDGHFPCGWAHRNWPNGTLLVL